MANLKTDQTGFIYCPGYNIHRPSSSSPTFGMGISSEMLENVNSKEERLANIINNMITMIFPPILLATWTEISFNARASVLHF